MRDMKGTVIIVSGGIIHDVEWFASRVKGMDRDSIICADGALRYLRAAGIMPDLVVGDMDSVDDETLRYFSQRGCEVRKHPRHKNETDTQLALEAAFALKPGRIVIFGALGGRLDHTLANISLLVAAASRGIEARIIDEACDVFVVDDVCEIEGTLRDTVSVLPLSSEVTGITLEGFEYSLKDGSMEIGMPYGISNRLADVRARISVQSGRLLVIQFGREVE
ncbi:MAG: thiamine diphosphokinase [Deltaproteobacteria bacterium]|nr:thiamine diphosphokinase [Deltaproteobacteria bacterium]